MLITVPRSIMIYPPGYGGDPNEQLTFGIEGPGISGLGDPCLVTDADYNPDTCEAGGGTLGMPPAPTSPTLDFPFGLPGSPTYPTTSSPSPTPSGSTLAQDLTALGPLLSSAAKSISIASGPYSIPGTNYIYNPATGQIMYGGTAVGTYNPATGAITVGTGTANSFMYLGVAVVVVMILLSSLRGK